MNKTVQELLTTPAASSGRKINETYIKSCKRNVIPEHAFADLDENIVKRSNQLKKIGLIEFEWIPYRINALYDFSYKKLKYYEKILTEQIKNDASCLGYKGIIVKIEYFPTMVYCERDKPPIKITIKAVNEEGGFYTCFIGFLISVERKEGFMEKERNEAKATILPLFLLNYNDEVFLQNVKKFLEDNFSCCVSHLKFSSYDLLFMLFLFSSPIEDNKVKATVIKYKGLSKDLDVIEYVIDQQSISQLWKEFRLRYSEEVSDKEAYKFLSVIEEKFYRRFKINLAVLELQEIKTALAHVCVGSLKVFESCKSYYVMNYLTHFAQEFYIS